MSIMKTTEWPFVTETSCILRLEMLVIQREWLLIREMDVRLSRRSRISIMSIYRIAFHNQNTLYIVIGNASYPKRVADNKRGGRPTQQLLSDKFYEYISNCNS